MGTFLLGTAMELWSYKAWSYNKKNIKSILESCLGSSYRKISIDSNITYWKSVLELPYWKSYTSNFFKFFIIYREYHEFNHGIIRLSNVS